MFTDCPFIGLVIERHHPRIHLFVGSTVHSVQITVRVRSQSKQLLRSCISPPSDQCVTKSPYFIFTQRYENACEGFLSPL